MSGNIDEYANIRMRQGDTRIGESAAMPSDLDASYLKLNFQISFTIKWFISSTKYECC